MATFRTRSIGPTYTSGWRRKDTSPQENLPDKLATNTYMEDWVGNPQGNNTLYYYKVRTLGAFTGDNLISGVGHRSCSQYASNRRLPGHLYIPLDADGSLAAEAAAESNPAREHVSIPNFIFELKDLPLLIKHRGSNILQSASAVNLNWQFGIKPMVSDLAKMLDFASVIEKRMKEISDLNNGGRLKRRVQLSKATKTASEDYVLESLMFFAESKASIVTTRNVWATCYWKPTTSFADLNVGSKDQRNAVRNALLGLTKESIPLTVWNALPWSWLVDWMSSAGNFIASKNNQIAYLAEPVVLCKHQQTTRTDRITGVPDWAGGDTTWTGEVETKERLLIPPALTANVPFLSGRQLSILGSLAALKL